MESGWHLLAPIGTRWHPLAPFGTASRSETADFRHFLPARYRKKIFRQRRAPTSANSAEQRKTGRNSAKQRKTALKQARIGTNRHR